MANGYPSILLLQTSEPFEEHKLEFDKILEKLENDKYHLERFYSPEQAYKLLKPGGREFNIVLLHFDSSKSPDLWREVFYKIRAHNKFSEVILIDINPVKQNEKYVGDILSSGCFAFFQYNFNVSVLFGYIKAARSKYESREYRAKLSVELNKEIINHQYIDGITVDCVIKKVAEKIKDLTKSQNIIITLLKNGRADQGYLHKVVYSSESIKKNELSYFCKPTEKNLLIRKILEEDIERRVFPNPRGEEEIKDLFDTNHETSINSCIILPLRHAGNPIGLIMVIEQGKIFDYETVNELTLEQIANQIAATIRYAEINEVNMRLSEALSALNNSKSLDEILEKLAEQACRLVNGLFSYIVMPNNKSRLVFRSAWSHGYKEGYLKILQLGVSIGGEKGFPIPGPDEDFTDLGITTLAFVRKSRKLLENILDTNYKEDDMEARNAYHFHPYRYANQPDIQPSSDIAIPIFLNTSASTSNSKSSTKVLGVINVEHEDRFAFTKEQIIALEQLAEFASIAIENKANQDFVSKLYDLIDFPDKEDLPFNKSPQNLEKFLSNIAIKMKDICGAELVTLQMVKDNKSFILGKSDETVNDIARWGNDDTMGHTFYAVKNHESVRITDVRNYRMSPNYKRKDGSPIQINENTNKSYNALFCFPMIIKSNHNKEKVVGTIWIYFKTNPDYSDETIKVLEEFASNVGDVINYAEKRTFEIIELEIKNAETEKEIIRKIVNSAKVYFGLTGATIYKANRDTYKLKPEASSFEPDSLTIKEVSFSEDNPEGLTGHLMLGKDRDGYLYSQGIVPVGDYQKYKHAMDYSYEEKKTLGSLIGIRFPLGIPAHEAIGVLVVADESLNSNDGGRAYENDSREKLKELSRIASESLQRFNNNKNLFLDIPPQLELQKQINILQQTINAQNQSIDLLNFEKDKLDSEVGKLRINIDKLNKKEILGKWLTFVLLLIPITYIIGYLIPFNIWFKGVFIAKLITQLFMLLILLLIPLWKYRLWLLGTALFGLFFSALELLPSILETP